jgi:hypothetical protein
VCGAIAEFGVCSCASEATEVLEMSMEIGLIVSLSLIVLLAIFGPKIRRLYLEARNRMREATLKRRMKS